MQNHNLPLKESVQQKQAIKKPQNDKMEKNSYTTQEGVQGETGQLKW